MVVLLTWNSIRGCWHSPRTSITGRVLRSEPIIAHAGKIASALRLARLVRTSVVACGQVLCHALGVRQVSGFPEALTANFHLHSCPLIGA